MNVYAKCAFDAYKKNEIMTLSSVGIISRLYSALLSTLEEARTAMMEGTTATKGKAIVKAIAILGELQASLNMEEGGEIALNLFNLYDYMIWELTKANLKNDVTKVEKAISLVQPLLDAWTQLPEQAALKSKMSLDNQDFNKEVEHKQIQVAG